MRKYKSIIGIGLEKFSLTNEYANHVYFIHSISIFVHFYVNIPQQDVYNFFNRVLPYHIKFINIEKKIKKFMSRVNGL